MVLGRISNLPTVWSNCLAGCWLGGWNGPLNVLLLCLGASLLYIGGMFLNDVYDVGFDAEFRRDRPIISGALSRGAATIGAVVLFVVGVSLISMINIRSGLLAVGLTILIVVYDWTHKRTRTAPLLMAICRFLLYLTAASVGIAGITPRAIFFAIALAVYVASLSDLARSESRPTAVLPYLWLLLVAPVLTALILDPPYVTVLRSLPLVLCIGWAMLVARESVGRAVGLLLAGIVLVDLVAMSTTSLPFAIDYLVLFGITLLFQKYIPAT
jgi:4-hydroxybenzoate polyprenyltransferase